MIVVWVAVYVLAAIGAAGLLIMAVFAVALARDLWCVKRTRLAREGKPLTAQERQALEEIEKRERNGGGS